MTDNLVTMLLRTWLFYPFVCLLCLQAVAAYLAVMWGCAQLVARAVPR